ncbi:Na/Pi cotransporter family protein [Roseibium litorale]|uniref:Na/Pi cotransporter family protein n=1 Tax=Roseibium litorale TaxID=2803841 RepID=A0ABR9CK88_9HYPH|nr:Na/Pi symporter [Roseibium litorale]MBD8890742.1 Na/Pi cotransporter family protein [Roseibium litorale]
MNTHFLALLGGTGIFLFGMFVLTDALRQLANARMRAVLTRFTRSPFSGAVAGMFTTAIIQSSSATMVTVISFVGAGLITFPQALGVIYGANIGTTITGWIVALLGLKLSLETAALPLLLVASLMRTAGNARVARIGLVLAGFCLIFIGLGMMQNGAAVFRDWLTPQSLPADTWLGRFYLLLLGAVITLIIQSSSAGVAMALVLYSAGSVTLAQGASLIVGMDVGTTATALLATFGGSRNMRRTAVAHVVYNIITGLAAFLFLGAITKALGSVFAANDPAALVTFHSLFNILGAVLMLPVSGPFARLIIALIPSENDALTDALDRRLLPDTLAALTAVQTTETRIARRIFGAMGGRLSGTAHAAPDVSSDAEVSVALGELETFLSAIKADPDQARETSLFSALLHETDHLRRLLRRSQAHEFVPVLLSDRKLRRAALVLGGLLNRAAQDGDRTIPQRLARLEQWVNHRTMQHRRALLLGEHAGIYSLPEVFAHTDALRWLQRSLHHAARITAYQAEARTLLENRTP